MLKNYTNIIVNWYNQNKRSLPWRKDTNPYHIWISEIMLQQTRIDTVINYYKNFLKILPNISSLASINEDKLLKLWEGLGYYNRAKNLKKAAQEIQNNHQGIFPTTYVDIIKLPGIGEYTASAISSICFNEKQVTIDGNVLRVYTRFYNDKRNIDDPKTKKEIHNDLLKIIPQESGKFNQGLMEIGETICVPNGNPKCALCPLSNDCQARKQQTYQTIPVKNPKKEKQVETYTVLIYHTKDKFAIYKRTKETILNKLWAFPTKETKITKSQLKEYLKEKSITYNKIEIGPTNTHIFTHKKWNMTSYFIEVPTIENLNYTWITIDELENNYAIPTAFQPFKEALIERIKQK